MKKVFVLSILGLSSVANAAIEWNTPQGQLKLYGDVEFNIDAASKKGQLSSVKATADKKSDVADRDHWDINGRLLIGLDGYREVNAINFAGFSVQPLADLSGDMNLDDAVFYFGQKNQWNMKVGRYEAYDMFPLGQDTFIEYSGNTTNDLYQDGYGYIYMMKEGRGRSNNGGSLQFNKPFLDNFNLELNALVNNGEKMFNGSTYHGYRISKEKNVVYVRPVLSWKNDSFSTAVAAEANVVKDAYGYYDKDNNNKWHDQSKRNGYGVTFSWNSMGDWSAENQGLRVNASVAYMNARDENDMTLGTNIIWEKFGIGYYYAHNNIKDYNPLDDDRDGFINQKGKYKIHTVNASYLFDNVLDISNFNIYLGGYWSQLQRSKEQGDDSKDRYGARVRFKYFY